MIGTTSAVELIDALRTLVRLGRSAKPAAHPSDLAASAASLLTLLTREGDQRLGQLACRLAVDPSVASRQVAALDRAGLVDRRPDPLDRRAQLLAITDRGREALDRYHRERLDWLVGALDGWQDEEIRALTAALRRLEHDVIRAHPTPSPVG